MEECTLRLVYHPYMQKYGGKVIHQSRDAFGVLEIIEDRFERSLHFGNNAKQSSTDIHIPARLVLSYTRAMAASLLFTPPPQRALLVGLGGGSLAKFLLHHFPECRVDVVEVRKKVHRLARTYFELPDDPNLTVFIEDGAMFMGSASPDFGDYDLMLIDAFLDDGIAGDVCGVPFLEDCRMRLSARGTLAMNLWSDDVIRASDLLEMMNDSFGQVLRLPVEGKDNIIGFGGPAVPPPRELNSLSPRARELADALDVEFPAFLKRLRKHNR
ncbi:hypothetical protein [Thiohalomonas denitrificans]|uniref:hypothetical protein n=1 Tax=Thiohalomonas denitrificans TaxID=415747 RepID=UPI0026F35391|nr:hypothetical protein [Thiohalomonas denitrificans]